MILSIQSGTFGIELKEPFRISLPRISKDTYRFESISAAPVNIPSWLEHPCRVDYWMSNFQQELADGLRALRCLLELFPMSSSTRSHIRQRDSRAMLKVSLAYGLIKFPPEPYLSQPLIDSIEAHSGLIAD